MEASLSLDRRVELLLQAMSLEEKAAQLGYGGDCAAIVPLVAEGSLGMGGCMVGDAVGGARVTNALRITLAEKTRLGIPPSVYGETTHSGGAPGTTVFPMPCSQGASWNLTLVEEVARVSALQLRASGGDHALSPVLQVATDPRFGRLEENFGEDPLLVASCGRAAVAGLQGRDGLGGASTYLGSPRTRVVSQAKHFAVYGAGSKDGYSPFGGGPNMRTVWEVYLRPWRDFAMAGGRGVMVAHNMIDWVPCHANKLMLTDVLRRRFGLDGGYVGSDDGNVEALHQYYIGFADNETHAATIAVGAGVDQDMPGSAFLGLAAQVRTGVVPKADLDRAAGNVLRKKFASGLFDFNASLDLVEEIDAPQHRELARRAAVEGCVLLKNDEGFLPLQAGSIKRVAVVGPFGDGPGAELAMLGGYSNGPRIDLPLNGVVTIAEAFRMRGVDIVFGLGVAGGNGGPQAPIEDFEKALNMTIGVDVVVVVLGSAACACCQACGNGEVGDRTSLVPEGRQLELLQAVLDKVQGTATKVVCVLIHGRPLSFGEPGQPSVLDRLGALLAAWRPGEEGGNAIVELLLGEANPSGKLAQAWQRSASYVHTPTSPWFQAPNSMSVGPYFGNGDNTPLLPLFPFAWGLSYTAFAFDDLVVDVSSLPQALSGLAMADLTLDVSVTATNRGTRAGATVVFVTYAKLTRMVVRNLRELAGFSKVFLQPGESRNVTIPIRVVDLARYDPTAQWRDQLGKPVTGAYVVDGGHYTFFAGDCVSNPALNYLPWENPCTHDTATKGVTATIGEAAELFGVYL